MHQARPKPSKYLICLQATMALHSKSGHVPILDIHCQDVQFSLLDDMREKLRCGQGREKRMPTLLLYDESGLKLFEEITYLEEYYLTNAEIEVLTNDADHIAERIYSGSQVIELGSGYTLAFLIDPSQKNNLRKVEILLEAFERAEKSIDYYALDLSLSELQRTLSAIHHESYKHVRCYGLHGTYDDGLAWLKRKENIQNPKCIMSLGSSIGNFSRAEAAEFLRSFADVLGEHDTMLVGLDACRDAGKVYHAYNDNKGTTHQFIRNGLKHANKLIGEDAFKLEEWDIIGEYDDISGRHQAFYSPTTSVTIDGVEFQAGERVRVEESYKYSSCQSNELWKSAGMVQIAEFGDSTGDYYVHMLSLPRFSFPLKADEYADQPVPSLHEFKQLWATWDMVTRHMITDNELLSKPIKLRNCCLFYLGHIPTFLDIYLTRAIDGEPTEPRAYRHIFERGIDPDVDNPENCHAHSEIPDIWPPLDEILTFQDRVRARVTSLYEAAKHVPDRKLGRALWLGFEHEAMHLETLLYMLLQSDNTVPPPGPRPDFKVLAYQAKQNAVLNEWVKVPASQVTLGLDDPETDLGPDCYFGWDNEKPRRIANVPAFEAKARPISNEDYARYLDQTQQEIIPASWTKIYEPGVATTATHAEDEQSFSIRVYLNGHSEPLTDRYLRGKAVRTVYGPVPLRYALDWPAIASYDELSGCAQWMNGRIPTVEEARSIYSYVDQSKSNGLENVLSGTISAVNGHLSCNGVEESPPSHPSRQSLSSKDKRPDPQQVFADLEGCNVGFQHFHPTSVTQNGDKLSGQGNLGGAWEWTSSVLEEYDGFKPMDLYPAYTADFFDGKHNVVLGGSWATHPRIAGRKTFVNWYQRNYLYAWATARLIRDF